MTTGSQKWLPLAARAKTHLQAHIDRRLARGHSPDHIRETVRGILRGYYRFPRLVEEATFSSLNFNPKPRGLRR